MPPQLHLAPDPAGHPRDIASIRIVLAEDHAIVRRNLRILLDREGGMEVISEAADISALLRDVPVHLPQVVVLDLRLPDRSSISAIRRLRQEFPDTEIVVLTMDESPVFAHRALEAGAAGFVVKDRADQELPEAIRLVARGDEYVSPRVAAALAGLLKSVSEDALSPRETEILRLIALGHTSAEIAEQLHLSRRTVETHRARIHRNLALDTRAQLVSYALGRHLIGN